MSNKGNYARDPVRARRLLCEWYDKNPGARRRHYESRYRLSVEVLNWLKSQPCWDCGNRYPSECMQFDHARGTKAFKISAGCFSLGERFMNELRKCDLVCANCHCVRTAQRRKGEE